MDYYTIVRAEDLNSLARRVNEMRDNGYEAQGGHRIHYQSKITEYTVPSGAVKDRVVTLHIKEYSQAMVLKAPKVRSRR